MGGLPLLYLKGDELDRERQHFAVVVVNVGVEGNFFEQNSEVGAGWVDVVSGDALKGRVKVFLELGRRLHEAPQILVLHFGAQAGDTVEPNLYLKEPKG